VVTDAEEPKHAMAKEPEFDDELARRVVTRFREDMRSMWARTLDTEEFRAAGGTDAGLRVLADLHRRSEGDMGMEAAVTWTALELGAALDGLTQDERDAVRNQVKADHPALVARVVELDREHPVTEEDEALAQRIAQRAPQQMFEERVVSWRAHDAEERAEFPWGPDLDSERMARESVVSAPKDMWASCLAKLAAQELGIPDPKGKGQWVYLLEHAAVERALHLVGMVSDATPEEIEQHRPKLSLSAAQEQAARRVALRAEEMLREHAMDRRRDSEMVESLMQDKDPNIWHLQIYEAAAAELGISYSDAERHPVALRAQELIPGLPTSYDVSISEQNLSPADAAKLYPPPGYEPTPPAAKPPGLLGESHQFPPDPPLDMPSVGLPVTHLGGHPALKPGQKQLWLDIYAGPAALVCLDRRDEDALAILEWDKVSGLEVEGPDAIQSRVTVPRLVAGGLFAFAFKKQQKRAYVVFSTYAGSDVFFEVSGADVWELRAALSPIVKWLAGSRATQPAGAARLDV
jgi:hypothetical protein